MTFLALKNHSKRTYRFRRGDFFPARATRSPWLCFALKSHIIEANLTLMVQEKGKIFSGSRSALAMIMFRLITHSKKTWRFKKKDFFFRFALRAHHDNFVSNQHSERTCSLTIKKGFFSGSRYALALIIFCLYYTLWKGFFLLEFDLTFY